MHPSSEISPEVASAVRAELETVLKSRAFWRSERNSRFLRFICETTLAGEGSTLNEYLIAHIVFHRGAEYSSGEDSVVRRQAYSLRQKLKDYYADEGKNNEVRIELPTGRYVPVFQIGHRSEEALAAEAPVDANAATAPDAKSPAVPADAIVSRSWSSRWSAVVLFAAVCVAAGYGAATWKAARAQRLDPVFYEIWGPWLNYSADGAIICYSNALTAGIRQTEKPFPSDNLTSGIQIREEEAKDIRSNFHLPEGGYFYLNPSLAHAKMGEALGSVPLTAMFTKAGVPVRAVQSRYINWQDFRTQNLILLGHSEANRWLDPILSNLPFRLAKTETDKPRRIVSPDHRPDERAEYFPDYSKGRNPPAEDFALISMLGGTYGGHGLVAINGVNTEGTEMALEYLTDAESLRTLERALRKNAPNHRGAWHFQAILHSNLRDGVPANIELVTTRVLP